MKILMASPECYPFAKAGGLGDVVGALPKQLAKRGHDVRICIPLYGSILPEKTWKRYDYIPVNLGNHQRICSIWKHKSHNITFYFIEYQQYFGSSAIYLDGPFNGERFAFFSRAVLDLCKAFQWYPDVIHCHDWTTGLIPVYLNTVEANSPLNRTASVFTIHNLQHQGIFPHDLLAYAGIPFSEFRSDSLESLGYINFMKGALFHSTKITTVSPTYANEIQTRAFGCGLESVLKFKAADLIGIINGIDLDEWNPEKDPHIAERYNVNTIDKKELCKKSLRQYFQLPQKHCPLIGVVSRLYQQKGLDVFMDVLPYVFQNMDIQVIVVGSGEPHWEYRLHELERQFPDKMRAFIGFNTALSHQVEAGCDLFMMPSRFEPCGLNQMYSMRYGTLPIVHATGGLVDTVENLDERKETGCGFVFSELCNDAVYNTLGWACSVYFDRPHLFRKMQHSAMQKDFSWEASVNQYESVYYWAKKQRG